MVSAKQFQNTPRPASGAGPTTSNLMINSSSTTTALPIKTPHHSNHYRPTPHHASHSYGSAHRITRRKSMSSSSVSHAAAVAAMKEVEEAQAASEDAHQSSTYDTSAVTTTMGFKIEDVQVNDIPSSDAEYPSPPPSLPNINLVSAISNGFRTSNFGIVSPDSNHAEHMILEEDVTEVSHMNMNDMNKSRHRRASEGAFRALDTGYIKNSNELKCDHCGKGYKHSSCLTKHLWEHTPEWNYTSKLLISKHQQVQLLEAASILVSMKPDSPPTSAGSSSTPPMTNDSSNESSSEASPPPPSTPPSGSEKFKTSPNAGMSITRRYSSSNRAAGAPYSRSYQPPPSGHFFAGKSVPSTAVGGFKQNVGITPASSSVRLSSPPSSLQKTNAQTDEALAAAVKSLNCGFRGTPDLRPVKDGFTSPKVSALSITTPSRLAKVPEHDQTASQEKTPTAKDTCRTDFHANLEKDVEMDELDASLKTNNLLTHEDELRDADAVMHDDGKDEDDERKLSCSSISGNKANPHNTRSRKIHEDVEYGFFGNMDE